MPNNMKLTDTQAKKILKSWPSVTESLFGGTSDQPWVQAQPKSRHATTPCLTNAGSTTLTTQPDGMWVRVLPDLTAADVFCVEVCGTLQNFQDKRSRFVPSTSALILSCKQKWLNEAIYMRMPRWKKMGVFNEHATQDHIFPVRYMRAVFVLREADYRKIKKDGVAAGHEFFLKHSSLGTFSSPPMQRFLKAISPERHFYTKQ